MKTLLNQNVIDLSILLILYDNLLASALFEYLMLKINNFLNKFIFISRMKKNSKMKPLPIESAMTVGIYALRTWVEAAWSFSILSFNTHVPVT